MKRIYLDHAATTPVDPLVLEAMLPYFTESFGNPSSIHSFGRENRKAIDEARSMIAAEIGAAAPNEIIFTGSGSESDNMAIKGIATAYRERGDHLITSAIEHHAVYDSFKYLEQQGFKVTYLPVNSEGLVEPKELAAALLPRRSWSRSCTPIMRLAPSQPIAAISEDP